MTGARRVLFLVVLIVSAALPAHAEIDIELATAVGCPMPGDIPITAETRPYARAAGLPDSLTCWPAGSRDVGIAVGEAKVYLRRILCASDGDNFGGAGADETIRRLNGGLAVCAAKFLKAANEQIRAQMPLHSGGAAGVCVREGYRTEEKQLQYWLKYLDPNKACDPRGKTCEHSTGEAIDINTAIQSNYERLAVLGRQYHLDFYLGARDPYHFRAMKGFCLSATSEPLDPEIRALIELQQYSPAVNPFQNPNVASLMQPTAQMLMQQQFQQALQQALQQPPQQQAPYQSAAYAPAPLQPLPSTIPSTLAPSVSAPVQVSSNPIGVIPSSGTSVSISATATVTPGTAPATTQTPSSSITPVGDVRTPWIDIILGVADYDPPSVPANTPAPLGTTLTDASSISGSAPTFATSSGAIILSPTASQTFVSDDLRPTGTGDDAAERSRILSALAQLRAGLERFLGMREAPRSAPYLATWHPMMTSGDMKGVL